MDARRCAMRVDVHGTDFGPRVTPCGKFFEAPDSRLAVVVGAVFGEFACDDFSLIVTSVAAVR